MGDHNVGPGLAQRSGLAAAAIDADDATESARVPRRDPGRRIVHDDRPRHLHPRGAGELPGMHPGLASRVAGAG
jgi:hypothetical protein